jgi:hypothetical protein
MEELFPPQQNITLGLSENVPSSVKKRQGDVTVEGTEGEKRTGVNVLRDRGLMCKVGYREGQSL